MRRSERETLREKPKAQSECTWNLSEPVVYYVCVLVLKVKPNFFPKLAELSWANRVLSVVTSEQNEADGINEDEWRKVLTWLFLKGKDIKDGRDERGNFGYLACFLESVNLQLVRFTPNHGRSWSHETSATCREGAADIKMMKVTNCRFDLIHFISFHSGCSRT